ncbi:hypothetical protein B0T24DRAFT_617235 [Lasiosphaeria ovina]|uniref:Uncharacterized protein n=1 Tax=Lasiosphaeria ovina TaxID=92902 RepID=A0AAE0KGK6_9PEZI|nr:hypothetical protein B0T24DRAFT_617235 [Lasiosphaeria ovina]
MTRLPLFVFLVAWLASLAIASAPTFCKCTCFKESKIIALGPQKDHPAPPPNNPSPSPPTDETPPTEDTTPIATDTNSSSGLVARAASSSCTQCNRAFCIAYQLPICRDAEEKDVVTSCFQRDSRKDQVIVWGFILGTAGLLGWAGLRRVLELRDGAGKDGGGFLGALPLAGGGGGGSGSRAAGGIGVVRRAVASVSGGGGSGGGGEDRGLYSPLENADGRLGRGPG